METNCRPSQHIVTSGHILDHRTRVTFAYHRTCRAPLVQAAPATPCRRRSSSMARSRTLWCGQDTQRSRSPLPRNRIPRSGARGKKGYSSWRCGRGTPQSCWRCTTRSRCRWLSFSWHTRMPCRRQRLATSTSSWQVEGLDDPAWLALEYQTSNSVGCHCHCVLDRSKLLKAARNNFHSRCQMFHGPIGQDQAMPFLRCKKVTDLAYILPCGRVGTLDFGGENKTLAWAQEQLQDRYGGQFHDQPPRLQVLCGCGLHFTQMRIDTVLVPGQDTCVMAMTAAWNKTPASVPEINYQDRVVPKPQVIPDQAPDKRPSPTAEVKSRQVQQKKMPRPMKTSTTTTTSSGPSLKPKSMCTPQPPASTQGPVAPEKSPGEEVKWVQGPPPTRDDSLKAVMRDIFSRLAQETVGDPDPDPEAVPWIDVDRLRIRLPTSRGRRRRPSRRCIALRPRDSR